MRTLALDQCRAQLERAAGRLSFDRPPSVVIVSCPETRPTALQAVRCLGRHDVPVIVLAAQRRPPTFASKYAALRLRCPDQKQQPEDFLTFLVELGRIVSPRPALVFCSDYDVVNVCAHAPRLRPLYDSPYLSADALGRAMDKHRMIAAAAEAGMDVPATRLVRSSDDVPAALDVPLPAVVKPLARCSWEGNRVAPAGRFLETFHRKAVRADARSDLEDVLHRAAEIGETVLVQEHVPGPANELYYVCLYADVRSESRAEFCGRKLRQMPADFGSGSLVTATPPHERLAELARRFVKHIGFHGIAEIEWKHDARDGRYKFMEINPRCWTWAALTDAVGVNLPLVQYLEVTGQEVPELVQSPRQVKAVDLVLDWRYFWNYRRGDPFGERLSFGDWLRSLRGERELTYFAPGDRGPGWVNLRLVLGELAGRAVRKLARSLPPRRTSRPGARREGS